MTDYAGLKAEIALPKYGGMTDAQIAAQLTTPMTVVVDVPAVQAFNILQKAPTGDWGRIVARSQMALSGKPILIPISAADIDPRAVSSNPDALIILAMNLTSTYQSDRTILHTSNPAELDQLHNIMTQFQYAGDIVAASFNAIMGLTQATTTRAAQLGFDPAIHNMEQEIAAARKWGT
jgi:hypothetical protein